MRTAKREILANTMNLIGAVGRENISVRIADAKRGLSLWLDIGKG
ncbi:hypothetical protein IMSAG025_00708 [Muribaculaceae bacterium]|nr:hypothetical protein IMSAG025_00708 [Muribaculaceae bacterium]